MRELKKMSSRDKLNVLGYTISLLILLGHSAIPTDTEWHGNWFPKKPGEPDPQLDESDSSSSHFNRIIPMNIQDQKCDDAEHNLWMDYDPTNISHHVRYVCLQNRKKFEPNITVQPYLREYTIPTEYTAVHRCMNESIIYDTNIPTFGTHRLILPVYGEYTYLPAQRWIKSLEHGGIVAVYHPCVNKRQLNDLRKLIKQCLYRHIITPYEKLDAERPFALIAWGRSLEMSVVDRELVVAFIRMNALQGPKRTVQNALYTGGIIEQAKIVSDKDDNSLCPNI